MEHYEASILNFEEKSANYLIIDNFLEAFNNMSKEDLSGARDNGQHLANMALRPEVEVRQDMMTFLLGMDQEGEDSSFIRKIARNVSNFKGNLNNVSQEGVGDRSLRVDKEYF